METIMSIPVYMQKTLKFLNYKAIYVQQIIGIHVQSNFNDVFEDTG